jgi:O-antigen ligase
MTDSVKVVLLIAAYSGSIALAPDPIWALAWAAPLLAAPVVWWTLAGPQRWLTLFFAAVLLLPPLPLAFGNSGPHPAILLAALGVFIGLLRIRDWRISINLLACAVVVFFCVLLASAGFAALYSGATIAAGVVARVILFGISVYAFFYTAYGPEHKAGELMRGVRFLFFASVIAALFACFDFYFQLPAPAGYGPQFVWLDTGVYRRAQGLFYEASTLGNFCSFFLVMIAVALFRPGEQRPLSRIWLLAGGVILSAALIFSYSRASLLNLAVSICMLAYVRRVRLKRVAIALLFSFCAGAMVVYSVFPSFALSYWLRLSGSLQYFWSSPEGVLSGRVASWRMLLGFLADHPWYSIFGVGYKTLPYSDFLGRTIIADNMYLSLLVETGLVGLGAFLVLNFAILRTGWRASRSASSTAVFFGTWILCFWTGQLLQMLSGDLMTYWRVLPVYFWVLAVPVRESRRSENP